MRSASFMLLGAAWGLVNAAPVASNVLDGILPASTRYGSDKTTGATLESLRILPDDDNDGLLDVAGSLKMLEGGEVLDLGGVVRVGGLLDACIEVVIDGVPTKRCPGKGRGRKHKAQWNAISKDGWTREEHRECAAHFKSWHKQHGSRSCSDRLRDAEKKIRELEKRLNECNPSSDYRPYHPVSHIKTTSHSSSNNDNDNSDNDVNNWTAPKSTWTGDSSNSNWSPDNNWKPESEPEHQGQQWRDETNGGKDCKNGIYTYTDKDDIKVKACIAVAVSAGPVSASATVNASADVDLKHGKVTATATAAAKVGIKGVAEASSKNTVKANADLEHGTADVHVKTDDALTVAGTKIVDTGLVADVKLNKPCSGSINAAGICVELSSDKAGEKSGTLGLGNLLGNGRVI